jgi:hypothetical protein
MSAFPHSYAKILAEGYDKGRDTAVSRTPMEDGMVKQLKTKSRVLVTRQLVVQIDTAVDYQNFITWFQTTIDYGTLWFDFTDPEDGVVRLARIVNGKLDRETPIMAHQKWRIGMQIETWSG